MTKLGIGSRWDRVLALFAESLFLGAILCFCCYAMGRTAYTTKLYEKTPFASCIDESTVPVWYKMDIEMYTNPYGIDPNKPMVALTFDDGPSKYTDKVLNILEKYNVRATFFMLGERISYYPNAVKRMKALGCEFGNHAFTHVDLTELKMKSIRKQLIKTDKVLEKITGKKTTLVRPPYGAIDKRVKKVSDAPLILWSMDTLDWERKNAKKIANYVLKHVEDGEIILLHDIHKETVGAVKIIIPQLIKKGYQIVTVSEMARARGVVLQDGEKYFECYP